MIDRHIMPAFGDRPLDGIRKMDVEAAVERWASAGLAKATGKFLLGQLSSIFREAEENDLISRNPARGVRLPANMAGRISTPPYTMPEVRKMLALVNGTDGIMLRVLLFCGLRPGEMLALRVGDLRENFLLVDESTDSAATVKSTKTGRTRAVPVPPGLLRDLRAYLAARPENPLELMFPGTRKEYWTVWGWNERLQVLLAGAIAGLNLRRFRATCATLLQADVADVQAILGHSTPEMTLEHYRRGLPERQSAAVEELERGMVQ
jgi:integrase